MTHQFTHPLPVDRPSWTEIQFCSWLSQAADGETCEYHRGFLALDLTPFGSPMDAEAREELGRVSRRAMQLAERGFVHLVQRRLGRDRFSYLAIARPHPGGAPFPFAILMTEEAA